jgi:ABC-type antimicrobial peptide transport system permease subunit
MNREDIQIIGVIKDVKHEIRGNAPTLYQLIAQNGPPFAAYFNIRTAAAPTTLAPAILEAIRGVEPNVAISEVKTLDATIEEGLAQEWILARASGFFAIAALLLAAIGLFGVMSFSVTRRTGEFGIRIALGARRVDIAWLALCEVLLLTLIGVFVGLTASLAMTRLITSLLFGLEPTDPVAMSSAVVLMLAVAVAAGYLPARRASRVNPLIALRHE